MRLRAPVAALAAATAVAAAAGPAHATPRQTPAAISPPTAATAEPVVPVPATGTLTLVGKGYGHGRGMSQYGAAAAARAGWDWRRITAFYYPGAAVARAATTTVRVGLADSIGTGLRVLPAPGLSAMSGGRSRTLPLTVTVAGRPTPVSRWEATASAAGIGLVAVTGTVRTLVVPAAPDLTMTAPTGIVRTATASGAAGPAYRGSLRAVLRSSTITPVLATSLDDYVDMVVPYEAISSWPQEALAAQAVAARTYALHAMRWTRTAAYDICSSTACQVIGGIDEQTARTRAAVAETAGTILTYGGAPILAEFGSSNGGWTVAGDGPYLPAQADPWDHVLSTWASWRADVPVARLRSAYPSVGPVSGLQVVSRDGHGELGGRVLGVRVIGPKGSLVVTGSALRSALGELAMRSNWFTPVVAPSRPQGPPTAVRAQAAGRIVTSTTTGSVIATGGGLRLLRSVGEFDATPGNDALGISADGRLVLVPGAPDGGPSSSPSRVVGTGFGDVTALVALDDLNGDDQRDLVVRRRDGRLYRFTSDGSGGLVPGPGVVVGVGWNGLTIVSADVTGDGRDDLVTVAADGSARVYAANGHDGFARPRVIGTLRGYRDISAQGDRTGDGRDDLLALDAAGAVWLLPVNGTASLQSRRVITRIPSAHHLL